MQQRHAEHDAEDDAREQSGDESPLGRRPARLLAMQGAQLVLQFSEPDLQVLRFGQLARRTGTGAGAGSRRGDCSLGLTLVSVRARARARKGRDGGGEGGVEGTLICADAVR